MSRGSRGSGRQAQLTLRDGQAQAGSYAKYNNDVLLSRQAVQQILSQRYDGLVRLEGGDEDVLFVLVGVAAHCASWGGASWRDGDSSGRELEFEES